MITELILNGLFGVADILLGLLPELEWTINTGAWSGVANVLSMVCYLLPMQHITGVITFILALAGFRIMVAFLRFILSLIPGI